MDPSTDLRRLDWTGMAQGFEEALSIGSGWSG